MRIDRALRSLPLELPRQAAQVLEQPAADVLSKVASPALERWLPIQDPIFGLPTRPLPFSPIQQLTQIVSQLLDMLRELIGRLTDWRGIPKNEMPVRGPARGQGAPDAKLEDIGGREAVRVDGPNGFLWKPISDGGQHKLVVLLPEKITARAKSVVIRDENGRVLERTRQNGDFNGRGIYRFKKEGGQYPPNSTVEVTLDDGRVKTYHVGDTSLRHD